MADDLIERMARAYANAGDVAWVRFPPSHKQRCIEQMRAAWAEAAEPSEAMLMTAEPKTSFAQRKARDTWNAMHGAAVPDESRQKLKEILNGPMIRGKSDD